MAARSMPGLALVLMALAAPACGGAIDGNSGPAENDGVDAAPGPSGTLDAGPNAPPPCATQVLAGGVLTFVHFTNPAEPCTPDADATAHRDMTIANELIRLIDATPAGETIRGNIYSISIDSVAEALVNAQERGVAVYISADAKVGDSTDTARTQWLDQLDHHVYCPDSTGCISSFVGGIAHSKVFTFSRTIDPLGAEHPAVSWFGSFNQTYGGDGTNGFNNAVTVYGDEVLYAGLRDYLGQMYARSPRTSNYYDPPDRGYIEADSATVYISPEADSDIAVNRLDDFTPDASCVVHVMNAHLKIARSAVTKRFVAMKQGGCKVSVLTLHIDDSEYDRLHAAGITVKLGPTGTKIHDKVVTVYGKGPNGYVYRVYTGSHNFNADGNREADEVFVKMAAETGDAHPLYDAFVEHFDDAWATGIVLSGGTP